MGVAVEIGVEWRNRTRSGLCKSNATRRDAV